MRPAAFALSFVLLAAVGCGTTKHRASVVRGTPTAFRPRCPRITRFEQLRYVSLDQAVAAARRSVVARKTVYYQDHQYRRNNLNTPVVAALQLSSGYQVGDAALIRLATKRCGRLAAMGAWAIEFDETLSPVNSQHQIVFVVRTGNGFKVF